jgi:hypothetical protein
LSFIKRRLIRPNRSGLNRLGEFPTPQINASKTQPSCLPKQPAARLGGGHLSGILFAIVSVVIVLIGHSCANLFPGPLPEY